MRHFPLRGARQRYSKSNKTWGKATNHKPEQVRRKLLSENRRRQCFSQIQNAQEKKTMVETFRRLWWDDEAQDLVEYALLLFLLGIAAITILQNLGTDVSKVFSRADSAIEIGG